MFSADFLALTAEKQKCHPQAGPPEGGECVQGEPSGFPLRVKSGLGLSDCAKVCVPPLLQIIPTGLFAKGEPLRVPPSRKIRAWAIAL